VTPEFRLEPLSDRHDRASFASGEEALDRYLRTQATQDIRRRIASCFAAAEAATGHLAAYYTIASASIPTRTFCLRRPSACRAIQPYRPSASAAWPWT
jgi:hypothetical protein